MEPSRYPVAASRVTVSALRGLREERRVGRFTARARTAECFADFLLLVRQHARESLDIPPRLLILPHLCNAIAAKVPRLSTPSKVLVEGFVLELIARGDLLRISTLSKEFEPYQVIYAAGSAELVRNALDVIYARLCQSHALSLEQAGELVRGDLALRAQNVQILLGSLVYRGRATTDSAPGAGISAVRLPHAVAR